MSSMSISVMDNSCMTRSGQTHIKRTHSYTGINPEPGYAVDKERERDSRDRHKDDYLPSTHRQNYFKPMGMRNNYLAGQPVSSTSLRPVPPPPIHSTVSSSEYTGRDPDDMVAMGTNWNPQNTQRYGRPGSYGNGTPPQNPGAPCGNPNVSGTRKAGTKGLMAINSKQVEPKYSDPMVGAPPSFQQRIAELQAIEAETIRWEKSRRIKKKAKDS